MRLKLLPMLDFGSDEWHMDETVVKVAGKKHYLWLIVDSETRFIIGFHLSPHRDSPQAFSLLSEAAAPWNTRVRLFLIATVPTRCLPSRSFTMQSIYA